MTRAATVTVQFDGDASELLRAMVRRQFEDGNAIGHLVVTIAANRTVRTAALLNPGQATISIVDEVQGVLTHQRQREAAVFDAFLRTEPLFAGEEVSSWLQPDQDPPDVLCRTSGGKLIGVELKTWANEGQIADARAEERRRDAILAALAPLPPNTTQNIAFSWLGLRPSVFAEATP